MNLQQRQTPTDEADLEITAELPVLDVASYEANVAASEAAQVEVEDTSSTVAMKIMPERFGSTDTWNIPSPSVRTNKAVTSEAANTVIDENRAKLEVNLQALSTTLRDVEERLTRKSERLAEIERALATAVEDRQTEERRAKALTDELSKAQAAEIAAQSRIAELQKALQDRALADEARRARDADLQAQLVEKNSQFQAQIAANAREYESQFAINAKVVARVEGDLIDSRARATGYLENLQTSEGRRSVYEDLITTLNDDLDERDGRISKLEAELAGRGGRVGELESELRERVARITALDKQVNALSAALAQRAEQQADVERARSELQQTVNALNGTLTERNDRVKALEGTVAQQTMTASQLRNELERGAAEHAPLVASVASLEAALKVATSRGDQQESVARAAQARINDLETTIPSQRRRIEQLEAEITTVRAELQSSHSSLQTAGTERNDHVARLAAGDARVGELEARAAEQQEAVRQLQAESNVSMARAKELEGDLRAAEETINRLESDARGKGARVQELEKINEEWRATVEEARHAISDRDGLIERLEQETAASALLVGHIQKSITRLETTSEHPPHEPAPDGATRLLIRTDGETEVVHVLGRKTSVGRTPDNDLQIDAKFISRHHAVILAGPAHAIIEDLNSTNGVLVNNRRITRQPLKDGDNVVIGKTQFRFVVRAARAMS